MGDLADGLREALAGRYSIERELGRGGMATVYLARDLRHDRPVALKVLHPELAAALGPERFQREIKMAARLQHPHILSVHDSGEAAGRLWFTMPYVEGESLRDRLTRERQLPIKDAVRLTREAALALDFAHRHDTIHRDIKPENILLVDGQALLADFGIARGLASDEGSKLTETGLAIGTPAYMSPEQAAGDRNVDARTDIYSLGTVLYEMLAGEPPFTGPTAQSMIARRLTESPRPLREVRDTVPDNVAQAVLKALARSPADRFTTAAEFARALEGAPTTGTQTAVTPAAPTRKRGAPPLTLALGIGFVLGLGVLFGWLRTHGSAESLATTGPRMVAVLPFQNLGDSSDEYFADGMTDEVRGKLATLPGLQVIASGSASQYKGTAKSPQVIAKELGVSYLLLGKIRWEKQPGGQSRVRVSPELVYVPAGGTATTKWQRAFDASITDVFQVQADIASRVAQALNVALEDSTQQQLAAKPTQNLAAYDAYLKGVEALVNGGNPVAMRHALDQFERAVALDTAFAQAWARLSDVASLLAVTTVPTPGLNSRALFAANKALAIAPDKPEGHIALGNYYRRLQSDYARAVQEYDAGQAPGAPNAEVARYKGLALQSLGRFEEATEQLRQASILDPRSTNNVSFLAQNLRHLRRYAEAREADDRAVALSPTNLQSLQGKILTLLSSGDLAGAQAALQTPPPGVDLPAVAAYMGTFNELYWALPTAHQDLMLRLPPTAFDDDRGAWGLALTGVYWLRGDSAKVRLYADSARIAMKEQVEANPGVGQLHALYGTALAYAGRKDEAVREGLKGIEVQSVLKDAGNGPYIVHQLVRIYIINGQYDKALDELEKLLTMKYDVSPGWLRIDPLFNPLRKNPRFQKLAAGVS
jgi:serine/threonine-protein kinase